MVQVRTRRGSQRNIRALFIFIIQSSSDAPHDVDRTQAVKEHRKQNDSTKPGSLTKDRQLLMNDSIAERIIKGKMKIANAQY